MTKHVPIAVIGLLLTGICSTLSHAEPWGPWPTEGAPLVEEHEGSRRDAPRDFSNLPAPASLLSRAVRFFQKQISPVDGNRCSMAPTCSHYSLQAIRKHGALLGFVMSADRIVHEYEEQRFVPLTWDGENSRFFDPVENNDFWFSTDPTSTARAPVGQGGE